MPAAHYKERKKKNMNIRYQLVDFPAAVKGCCTKDKYGSYGIYINKNLSKRERKKVYEHELKHIQNGDFDKFDVQEIEMAARG